MGTAREKEREKRDAQQSDILSTVVYTLTLCNFVLTCPLSPGMLCVSAFVVGRMASAFATTRFFPLDTRERHQSARDASIRFCTAIVLMAVRWFSASPPLIVFVQSCPIPIAFCGKGDKPRYEHPIEPSNIDIRNDPEM